MILPPKDADFSERLKKFNWSFSSVNSYANCPRCFYLSYLHRPKLEKLVNFFSDYGSFCHHLLEEWYLGEKDFFDLCEEFENEYDNAITCEAPPNKWADLATSYREAALDMLERLEELPSHMEVLEVECEIRTKINGLNFVGYADLILRHKDTGAITVVDHKSKKSFTSKKETAAYARQLYLYSQHVFEQYGQYPEKLVFNHFRSGKITEIDFDMQAFEEAKQWFYDTVSQIFMDSEFRDLVEVDYEEKGKDIQTYSVGSLFFCEQLCGVRAFCNRSSSYKPDE